MTNEQEQADAGKLKSTGRLERMNLSPKEHTALIYASVSDSFLQCAFGSGWVSLLPVLENRWAFDLVERMRSNDKSMSGDE